VIVKLWNEGSRPRVRVRNRGKRQGNNHPGKKSGKQSKFRPRIKEAEWGGDIDGAVIIGLIASNRRELYRGCEDAMVL
jgi:hypothetical protein